MYRTKFVVDAYVEPCDSIIDGNIRIANGSVDAFLVAGIYCAVIPRLVPALQRIHYFGCVRKRSDEE